MLPKFIIAGIMKSGTTYLDNLVRKHPQIAMPMRSMDQSFFDNDEIWKNGLDWYENIFSECQSEKGIIGQTSADCAFNPESLDRIKETIPDVKLIFVIRDPIERLYSLYWHQISMGREYYLFEDIIIKESKRTRKSYYNFKMYSYVARSKYKAQFDKVFETFEKTNILIIPFEVLVVNELEVLNIVFDFLGVDSISNLDEIKDKNIKQNKAKIPSNRLVIQIAYLLQSIGMVGLSRNFLNRFRTELKAPPINDITRKKLETIFEEDIKFHEKLLNEYKSKIG
jgi:hypothetical protein